MLKNVTPSLPSWLAVPPCCARPRWPGRRAGAGPGGASRIGFIFTERLMTDSKMAKAADAKIEAEFSRRQKANKDMLARLKTLSEKLDADAPA